MNSPFQDLKKLAIATLKAFVIVFLFFLLLFFAGCRVLVPKNAMIIPQEPTIWIVSQVDAMEYKFGEGLMFYKIIPINPGQMNVRPVWIRDYTGAFEVGDRVTFEVLHTIRK